MRLITARGHASAPTHHGCAGIPMCRLACATSTRQRAVPPGLRCYKPSAHRGVSGSTVLGGVKGPLASLGGRAALDPRLRAVLHVVRGRWADGPPAGAPDSGGFWFWAWTRGFGPDRGAAGHDHTPHARSECHATKAHVVPDVALVRAVGDRPGAGQDPGAGDSKKYQQNRTFCLTDLGGNRAADVDPVSAMPTGVALRSVVGRCHCSEGKSLPLSPGAQTGRFRGRVTPRAILLDVISGS